MTAELPGEDGGVERQSVALPDEPTTAQASTWRVTGRVSFADGAPREDALIGVWKGLPSDRIRGFRSMLNLPASRGQGEVELLLDVQGEPFATTEVQRDGSFAIDLPTDHAHVRLSMVHRFHGLTMTIPVHLPDDGEVADVGRIATYAGGRVLGRIRSPEPDFRPSGEVRLAAEPDPMQVMIDPASFFATVAQAVNTREPVDEEGRFEFWAVTPQPRVRIAWGSEGWTARLDELSVLSGSTIEVVLTAERAGTVRMLVTDDEGHPVEAARVAVDPFEAQGNIDRVALRRSGRTDADGICEIADLPPGRKVLFAEFIGLRPGSAEVAVRSGETLEATLTLGRGAEVFGRVVDETGQPIEGARIAGLGTQSMPFVGDVSEVAGAEVLGALAKDSQTHTDENGEFRVGGLPQGAVTIVAVHDDYAASLVSGITSPNVEPAEVVMQLPTRLSGTVVGVDTGKPVRNFEVRLKQSLLLVLDRDIRIQDVHSDEGRFQLDQVPPGRYTIAISSAAYGTLERSITLEPNGSLDVGVLELPLAAAVSGRVVDYDGNPVEAAQVFVRRGGMLDDPMVSRFFTDADIVTTDARGEFRIDGLTARRSVTLRATAEGHAPGQSARLELFVGETLRNVQIRLGRGGDIDGVVLLPPGARTSDWQIFATRKPFGGTALARLENSGRFELLALEPGSWDVQALDMQRLTSLQQETVRTSLPTEMPDIGKLIREAAELTVTSLVDVEAGGSTSVELDATDLGTSGSNAELVATVTIGGRPMRSGFAEFRGKDGSVRVGLVEDGELLAAALAPDTYEVCLRSGKTYSSVGAKLTVEIPESARGNTVREKFDLPAGSLSGTVFDESGAPQRGVFVRLERDGEAADPDGSFTVTDQDGAFSFEGLAAGTYSLHADTSLQTAKAAGSLQGVTLDDGESKGELMLVAGTGVAVAVTVRDPLGQPIERALVAVVDGDGNPVAGLPISYTDPSGRAQVGGLPEQPEAWVMVRAQGFAPLALGPYVLAEDAPGGLAANVRADLPYGTPVEIQAIDVDGSDLSGSEIRLRIGASPWVPSSFLTTRRSGPTIDLGLLPPGDVEFAVGRGNDLFLTRRRVPASGRARFVLTP